MLLTNQLAPSPSSVQLSARVGLAAVLQQTPLEKIFSSPPMKVTNPPLSAVLELILAGDRVVTIGSSEKTAVRVELAVMVKWQVGVYGSQVAAEPLALYQPKTDPLLAAAVTTTALPVSTVLMQG